MKSQEVKMPAWVTTALMWTGIMALYGVAAIVYIMLAWNLFLSPVFSLRPIGFGEAFGCLLLLSLIPGVVWGAGQTKS